MRLRHRDGTVVHLAYGTNVHPAQTLAGVLGQLDRYAVPVRAALDADRLGLGLWLARDVATELVADPAGTDRLRRALTDRGLEVVTLNGFPYRGFHDPVVKHAVYRPDWTDDERLRYTVDLAAILAVLLPDDAGRGSISTLPLGWRAGWSGRHRADAGRRLAALAAGLARQADRTGRPVRVGLEPEPGCVVETTAQAAVELSDVDTEWLGVCLDCCHLAVGFEPAGDALSRLRAAGLPVVKTQASCALQADHPADPATRSALAAFAEPRFLHQVRARPPAGPPEQPSGVDDLDAALAGGLPADRPWRVHFHVPVHRTAAAPLASTQPALVDTLGALLGGDRALTDHVEVETYTWQALPADARPAGDRDLVAGIAAELAWTRDRLLDLGLKEEAS
jgi:sugar phosphate isomerase/epimerase